MRYPASEKLEIIRLVEQSHLSAKQTLDKLGIPRTTFYRWYDKYLMGGADALEDKAPMPARVWNRIPDDIRMQIIDLALEQPELSPRELAVRFTDARQYFVSEASVYRLLKAHDLITSPAFVVIKAANEFKDKTTAINQMWQTDFTYIKIIGWGWYYLSTILDDYSRYVVAWKLCTTMKTSESQIRWNWLYRLLAVIKSLSNTNHGCCRIMAPVMSQVNLLIGSRIRAWSMCAVLHIIPKHKVRSNAGIKR